LPAALSRSPPLPRPPTYPPFPYTTLFRSRPENARTQRRLHSRTGGRATVAEGRGTGGSGGSNPGRRSVNDRRNGAGSGSGAGSRSEEHTSELQSRFDLVCRLLLEKKDPKD